MGPRAHGAQAAVVRAHDAGRPAAQADDRGPHQPPLPAEPLRTDLAVLLALAVIACFTQLGAGSLTTWDEAYYAEATRALLQTHDWLTMHYGDDPWFDKPPFAFWCQALAFRLFGINEWAARLPSACWGVLTSLVIYLFAVALTRRRRVGLMAAAIWLSTPHALHFARMATTDMAFVWWTTVALFGFWQARTEPRWAWLGGIAFGMAMLTKSAAGAIIPIIACLYAMLARDGRMWRGWQRLAAWACGVAIGLSWPIAEWLIWPERFVREHVGHHVLMRASVALDQHAGEWDTYLRVLKNKAKPWGWVAFLAWPYALWRGWRARHQEVLFLVIWVGAVVMLYSLAASKLHWYILPVYPALAMLIAVTLDTRWPARATSWLVWVLAGGVLIWQFASGQLLVDGNRETKALAAWLKQYPQIVQIYLVEGGDAGVRFYFRDFATRNLDVKRARGLAFVQGPWAAVSEQQRATVLTFLPVLREGEQYTVFGRL